MLRAAHRTSTLVVDGLRSSRPGIPYALVIDERSAVPIPPSALTTCSRDVVPQRDICRFPRRMATTPEQFDHLLLAEQDVFEVHRQRARFRF